MSKAELDPIDRAMIGFPPTRHVDLKRALEHLRALIELWDASLPIEAGYLSLWAGGATLAQLRHMERAWKFELERPAAWRAR